MIFMKTMAAVLIEINKPLMLMELELPQLKSGQVLVDVKYSGICHSQLNEIRGKKGPDKFLPHTLGHEGSGIVEAIGQDVTKVKKGDHVVLTWIKGKGKDVPSASYKSAEGKLVNSGAISTFMTKAVISENRLVKIDNKMPLKEAVLLGCAIPTGAGIVLNTLKVRPGNSMAIFGIGGIGSSALIVAVSRGASPIIAVDVSDYKRELSKELGADHFINAKEASVEEKILSLTGGRGVDFAIEASGNRIAMETAFMSVRDKGGLCVLAGNLSQGEKISIDPFDLIKGKRIVGTWGGESDPDRDIPDYVDLYLSGKLALSKILTHQFKLREINEACDRLSRGELGRAVIKNDE